VSPPFDKKTLDKWVPVTTAWRVQRLRIEERPAIWRVVANLLRTLSVTKDKEFGFQLAALVGLLQDPQVKH
jgi:hypothetical protein